MRTDLINQLEDVIGLSVLTAAIPPPFDNTHVVSIEPVVFS